MGCINVIDFRETEKWRKGHKGEKMVDHLLARNGWYTIPSYEYTGGDQNDEKAPKLKGYAAKYVLPDIDISKDGKRIWAEVKTKESATLHRKTNTFEHGIPLRHFDHYLKVEEITGCPVWLFVYEEKDGVILCEKLDLLAKSIRKYLGNKMSYGGMAFFPREKFKVWKTVS